jgi:hypothetical protein
VLFDNIRALSRQIKFYTLPKLSRWLTLLSEAHEMHRSGAFSGFGMISPMDVEYRANVVKLLMERLNDVLVNRCMVLLGEAALS